MTNPIVQLRRKNEGAIFTVADAGTRQILHWHRPGEALPFYIHHVYKDYEVTKEDIKQATLKGRVVLKPLCDYDVGTAARANWGLNDKGTLVGIPKPSLWSRLKAWVAKQINKLKGVFA